ncbi:MAG TPA: glycosyltransferase [Vicinamibacterales bacterium]|nr:glycosyltransferase [Vicinamibacterales bacterium]
MKLAGQTAIVTAVAVTIVEAAAPAAADADVLARPGSGQARAIHQVLATLGYGDAIGNEVLGIQRVLRGAGYESEIFVQTAERRVEHLTLDYLDLLDASHPDNILIHHFSIGSRASRVAYALPDRMALVYHNITPPEYFVGVNKTLVKLCFLGRRELAFYKDRVDLALGDSEYNRQELEAIGFPATAVLPVVPDFSHLGAANFIQASQFDDDWVNILFVGRVIPNKRIEDVVRCFHAYKQFFNPRSRLLLVGSSGGFEKYLSMVQHFIARIGATDVHILGHVANEELAAYYQIADLFLCCSEHEGFCVPLVESFHMGVPVLAYAATAVPTTMDGAGILFTNKHPMHVAALIDAVMNDRALQDRIIDGQFAALDRMEAKDFGGTLLKFMDQIAASPRVNRPAVAFDFWDQLRLQNELEELWAYRPSAFKALPPEGEKISEGAAI